MDVFVCARVLRTELSPSVSRMIMSVVSFNRTGVLHIHMPFVQGLVEGPIANPSILMPHDNRFSNLADSECVRGMDCNLLLFQESVGEEGFPCALRSSDDEHGDLKKRVNHSVEIVIRVIFYIS